MTKKTHSEMAPSLRGSTSKATSFVPVRERALAGWRARLNKLAEQSFDDQSKLQARERTPAG